MLTRMMFHLKRNLLVNAYLIGFIHNLYLIND